MSKFYETLEELIFDRGLDVYGFAKDVQLDASCISDYKNLNSLPSFKNLIRFADYFNCSTDFLMGREESNFNLVFKPCPPFGERLKFVLETMHKKPIDIYGDKGISKSEFFDWKNGKRLPSCENLIKLADKLDCRVDFLLGRE